MHSMCLMPRLQHGRFCKTPYSRAPAGAGAGRHLAALPLPPRVGKMLLYGALFGCLDPVLTVACCMAYRCSPMRPTLPDPTLPLTPAWPPRPSPTPRRGLSAAVQPSRRCRPAARPHRYPACWMASWLVSGSVCK